MEKPNPKLIIIGDCYLGEALKKELIESTTLKLNDIKIMNCISAKKVGLMAPVTGVNIYGAIKDKEITKWLEENTINAKKGNFHL